MTSPYRLVETLQARLGDLGYYTGRVDDDAGPLTSRAIVDFKRAHGFTARDYAGPLTLALLFSDGARPVEQRPAGSSVPPWYEAGKAMLGLHERTDNAELRAWLRSDGATLGDPKVLPWCGDFVETAIRRALADEPIPDNPYLARNWLQFGRECGLELGAVCVFWRGSKSGTSGHVGFVAGDDASAVHVLGGNQSNRVSVTRIAKSRLLGCRWPVTAARTTSRVAREADGALSTNEA